MDIRGMQPGPRLSWYLYGGSGSDLKKPVIAGVRDGIWNGWSIAIYKKDVNPPVQA